MNAFRIVLVSLAGWMNREQQWVIGYLQEEVEVLKEQRGDRLPKFSDDLRRREGSLRRGGAQFCEDYHRERNHQGMGNKIVEPDFSSDGEGEVGCRQRLGGLLRYYYRYAA